MKTTEQLYGIIKNSDEIRMVIDEIENAKRKCLQKAKEVE